MGKTYKLSRCPNGYSVCFIIATLLLVGLLLTWQAVSQYSQFTHHQKLLSKQSVTGAANEISAYVKHLRHQVNIFSHDRLQLLRKLATSPENDTLLEQLTTDAAAYFPNYFAITIANGVGTPIIGNYDLLVNELCQSDIKNFSKSGFSYDIFIHPHPEVQHFDVMTPIDLFPHDDSSTSEVFFISFKPTDIQRFLGNAQIFGHRLYLVKNNISGLIELTADGTRVDLIKNNKSYILSAQELENNDYSLPVQGTRWDLVSVADSNLYTEQKNKIVTRAIYIYLVFILISLAYLAFLSNIEKKRNEYEIKLKKTKEQLEHTLDFSRIATWSYNHDSKIINWSHEVAEIFSDTIPQTYEAYLAITHPEDRDSVIEYFNKCLETDLAHNVEHRIQPESEQNTVWVELSGSIDKTSENQPVILGLIRDISTRKLQEALRLKHEKNQRDTLIREVHHRIKNNLQGVIGLLRRHTKTDTTNNTTLEHAISQLNSVSLIHGLSCEQNGNYIFLDDLVSSITVAANSFTGCNISPFMDADSHSYHIQNEDDAVAIALIINELIFNAIKHSPDAGKSVRINLSRRSSSLALLIENNCLPQGAEFEYQSKKGLGAGLNLVYSLLPKNGAHLTIHKKHASVVAKLTLTAPVVIQSDNSDDTTRQSA